MIRIPTGKVPKNTARSISIFLGVVAGALSAAFPAHSTLFREIGIGLGALGVALGGSK